MNRRMITGWGGALGVSALLVAACGSAAQSTTPASSAAAGHASSATSNAATTPDPVTSHAPIAAAVDPCTLLSSDQVKAAVGYDPGPGKSAAGTPACTYGAATASTGYLLVADADTAHVPGFQDFNRDTVRAKVQESLAKTGGTIQDTSGVGDWGFMVLGTKSGAYIFFVKGSVYVSIVLVNSKNVPTAEIMTALAKAAADRV